MIEGCPRSSRGAAVPVAPALVAVASVVRAVSAALAIKALWRRDAKSLGWRRLWAWGAAGGTAAVIVSVIVLGRDGRMAGYALLVLGVALPQWWLLSFRR